MKTKHTPGPWHRTGAIKEAINTNDKHIAMVNFSHHGSISDVFGEEHEANAKLIAAAPELLEACQLVALCKRGGHLPAKTVIKLMEAIIKATE